MNGNKHVPKSLQTPAELSRLAVLAQQGDEEAMLDLMWRMKPLVINLALKYGHGKTAEGHGRYNEAQRYEITQEAWVGFFEAVKRWDPNHPAGKSLWTVAGYRIGIAIKHWQASNSGGLGLTRHAWERAYAIDKALEEAGMQEWEAYSDTELKAATGVHSAGAILRARKPGHSLLPQDADNIRHYQSAEDDYLEVQELTTREALLTWLREHPSATEDDVYWQLEDLGLAGELEAQAVLEAWQAMQEEQA